MDTATADYHSQGTVSAWPDASMEPLYDHALSALREAITAIREDDIEVRCAAVSLATEIVATLYLHRNASHDCEAMEALARCYEQVLGSLLRINVYNDPEIARETIARLEASRELWLAGDEHPIAPLRCGAPGASGHASGSARHRVGIG